jgi:molybdenum cofactor cytidylyltransferase
VNAAGLILSAGESRRMGSPKALLLYQGETFLDGLIARFSEVCAPVIVVLGHDEAAIRARLRLAERAVFVTNPEYRNGQLSSMQCGLRAVPEGVEGILFTLVDHPCVRSETLRALLAPPAALIVKPRYEGRSGHPVFFSRSLVP